MPVKTCSSCREPNDVLRIMCGACGEPLEETLSLRFVGSTALLAVLVVFAMKQTGLLERFSVPLALQLEVALLFLTYPPFKLVTKLRDGRRRVTAEMGRSFSNRSDRVVITVVLLLMLLLATGVVRLGTGTSAPQLLEAKVFLGRATVVAGLLAIAAMVRDQGLRFFDFRIRNTSQDRRLDAEP